MPAPHKKRSKKHRSSAAAGHAKKKPKRKTHSSSSLAKKDPSNVDKLPSETHTPTPIHRQNNNPFASFKNLERFQNSLLSIAVALSRFILQQEEDQQQPENQNDSPKETSSKINPKATPQDIYRCIICLSLHFLFLGISKSILRLDTAIYSSLLHLLQLPELDSLVKSGVKEVELEYFKAMYCVCLLGMKLNQTSPEDQETKSEEEAAEASMSPAAVAAAKQARKQSSTSASTTNAQRFTLENIQNYNELISPAIILFSTLLPDHANSFELNHVNMDEITDYELKDVSELDNFRDIDAIPVRITLAQNSSSIRTFLLPIPLSFQFSLLLRLKIALNIKMFDTKLQEWHANKKTTTTSTSTPSPPRIGSSMEDLISLAKGLAKECGFVSYILWYEALIAERNCDFAAAYRSYILCSEEALPGALMKPCALYRAALLCTNLESNQEANDALKLLNGETALKQRLMYKSLEDKAQNLVLEGIECEDECLTNDLEQLNLLIRCRETATRQWFKQDQEFHALRKSKMEGSPTKEDSNEGLFEPPNLQNLLNITPSKELIVDDEWDTTSDSRLRTTGRILWRFATESVEWYQWLLFLLLVLCFAIYMHHVSFWGSISHK